MKADLAILIFAVVSVLAVKTADIPINWKICNRTDPKYLECLRHSVQDVISSLGGGLKSFKILPLEPLTVNAISIGQSEGPVALKQEYRNIKLYGLTKNLGIILFRPDWDKMMFHSETFNPQVDFVADYKVEGKVLLLPVTGSGKSNITMYNVTAHNTIEFETFEKNGETYLRSKKYTVKLQPARVQLRFDNLFNGDPVLGEQMNRFINENSESLFKELQSSYEETFGLIFNKISNDVFSRVPLKQLFP